MSTTAAERVVEILGDPNLSLSPARKRPAESNIDVSPAAKRRSGGKVVSSLDFAAFQVNAYFLIKVEVLVNKQKLQARVATFTSNLWCRSDCETLDGDLPLSPLQLARRGWVAVQEEERVVQCPSCREILSLALPSVTSPVFKQFLVKQAKRVENGHAEFCPWAASPCPEAWARPQVDLAGWQEAAQSLCHLGQKLPHITRSKLRPLDQLVSRVAGKLIEDQEEVKETAALLAILGWRDGSSVGKKVPDTLLDLWGVRQVGLWSFRSLEEEADRKESQRVARQLAGEGMDKLGQQTAGEEVDEQNDDHGKKVFDPVKEHLSWNPVRSNMGGIEGWLSLANERKGKEREIDSYSEKKPDTALQRVRHLLDQWV